MPKDWPFFTTNSVSILIDNGHWCTWPIAEVTRPQSHSLAEDTSNGTDLLYPDLLCKYKVDRTISHTFISRSFSFLRMARLTGNERDQIGEILEEQNILEVKAINEKLNACKHGTVTELTIWDADGMLTNGIWNLENDDNVPFPSNDLNVYFIPELVGVIHSYWDWKQLKGIALYSVPLWHILDQADFLRHDIILFGRTDQRAFELSVFTDWKHPESVEVSGHFPFLYKSGELKRAQIKVKTLDKSYKFLVGLYNETTISELCPNPCQYKFFQWELGVRSHSQLFLTTRTPFFSVDGDFLIVHENGKFRMIAGSRLWDFTRVDNRLQIRQISIL